MEKYTGIKSGRTGRHSDKTKLYIGIGVSGAVNHTTGNFAEKFIAVKHAPTLLSSTTVTTVSLAIWTRFATL